MRLALQQALITLRALRQQPPVLLLSTNLCVCRENFWKTKNKIKTRVKNIHRKVFLDPLRWLGNK